MRRGKKYIAPIIIGVLLTLYYAAFAVACIVWQLGLWEKLLGILVPLALAGATVYVMIERIKEIRSGEEDDLSKY